MKALNAAAEERADGQLTKAEGAEYDKLEKRLEELSGELERRTRFGRQSQVFEAPVGAVGLGHVLGGDDKRSITTGEEAVLTPAQSFTEWRSARGELGQWARESLSLGRALRGLATGDWRGAEAEHRAMQENVGVNGGYLLPAPLASFLIDKLRAKTVVMEAGAQTVPMDSAELAIAVVTGDPSASWRQELSTITAGDGNTLGRIVLQARSCVADVLVSKELVADAPNAASILEASLQKALALKLDAAALTGSGAAAEPGGLTSYSAGDGMNYVQLLPDGDYYKHDYVLVAINDILADNGPMPTAMIMNPRTRVQIARLKDGDGLPLPAPDLVKNLAMLQTTSVPITDTLGSGTDLTKLFIGDFSEMYVGIRQAIEIQASPFAGDAWDQNAVVFRASMRADIALAHACSFAIVEGVKGLS